MKNLEEISARSFLSTEEIEKLEKLILETGYMSKERTRREIEWYLIELGIDEYYFKNTSIEDIARHLIAISASELVSRYGGIGVGIQLINEEEDRAVYIVEEDTDRLQEIENRIERKYPLSRIESYITREKSGKHFLRLYVVSRPMFPGVAGEEKITFEKAADSVFLSRSEDVTKKRYRGVWESMNERVIPVVHVSEKEETGETRIMIGIHTNKTQFFLPLFSHLFNNYHIYTNRKYREIFKDGKKIYSFYFDRLDPNLIEEFTRELVGVVMLPDHPLTGMFKNEVFSPHQTLYAISAVNFTYQFLSVLTEEYSLLNNALKDQPEARGILESWKLRMSKDTFSQDRITQTVMRYPEIIKKMYEHFETRLHPFINQRDTLKIEDEIKSYREKQVTSDKDRIILDYFMLFNNKIIKTNFFIRNKRCISYKLDTSFLPKTDFPETPFGLFFFTGREFIGFHIRFRDIARGGIRIVRSRHQNEYEHNVNTIFLENYNLANTQQKKNKDIPEGGSKGTILLHLNNQREAEEAFISYIDSMLDLLVDEEEVLDTEGYKDILFLGPDEGTAELMNWAVQYAKKREYPFWRAFTTGKALSLGGIPHDLYGMTTNSVHEYVLGILNKLGQKEEEIVKIQTGGPDGDLGSNEIKISKDKTIGIVDGSGVLFDPHGIDRKELLRLAEKRVTVEHFNRTLLSKDGFFVSINDREVNLPDGTFVANGEDFRNKFHLSHFAKSDLFVPCGGRPASININNWRHVLDRDGRPKFKIIVEGANLFITEEARLRLEENGVILIKDASANKGGVTSSSLEVFASLAMTDEEFDENMTVKNGVVPPFREKYIEEVLRIIRSNARAEFEVLWKEHEESGLPLTELTNRLSLKINNITDAVVASNLAEQKRIREKVILSYTPRPLLDLVGVDKILSRVPENYLKSIIGTKIATGFIYSMGLNTNEVDFYNYVNSIG